MTLPSREPRASTFFLIASFTVCVVLANWAVVHVGTNNGPGHPRTIPLGFGMCAPSGVLFAGALFTLRDAIYERVGPRRTLLVIIGTAPLTALTSAASLALASVVTFFIAEAADWAVYTRTRRRGRSVAVLSSNVASSIVDSAVFLTVAFGGAPAARVVLSMTVGKFAVSAVTLAVLRGLSRVSPQTNTAPPVPANTSRSAPSGAATTP